ncbi:unnamed protein product [Didymodactylos carnosus]|uniref:Uncharacterized protein n=1 Tax=Didymodactylos carnosus TaxID=1234261 RepID=A0A8S2DHE7_9BILA|nr:unnamed protein product [Didymodactylos carnosus]CAF3733459.1 unnamed protein product [Didymodactylos carnosus]CAF4572710.1 unnamed protein product [Didymodactylos carnosus]
MTSDLSSARPRVTIAYLESIYQNYAPKPAPYRAIDHFNEVYGTNDLIINKLTILKRILTDICITILLSSISIAKIVVYVQFRGQCPVRPQLPLYLLVAGATTLAYVFCLMLPVSYTY